MLLPTEQACRTMLLGSAEQRCGIADPTQGDATMFRSCLCVALVFSASVLQGAESAISVDKKTKTITITSAVAPRKLPKFKDIYPIEVIATLATPKGQKAHETIVTFDAK